MEKKPQHLTYMKALQMMADHSRQQIAALMPHAGERGRICEEIIRSVLNKTLPKRFSIGSGVLISSEGLSSRQTDIVIFDNFHNSPLLSEFGSCLFPVEIVYATIEVKSVLTRAELLDSIEAVQRIRDVGSKKHYIVQGFVQQNDSGRFVQQPVKRTITVPPRSYLVAFCQKGLGSTYEQFCANVRECLDQEDRFLHGVCILDSDWYAGRIAYRKPSELYGDSKDALLNLYLSILRGQQNYSVYPMDLEAYLSPQTRDEI